MEEKDGIFSEKLDDCCWNFPCFCELDWKKFGIVHLENSAAVEHLLPFQEKSENKMKSKMENKNGDAAEIYAS